MPNLITKYLTKEQQEQLELIRDTDNRPYMRERAAAILKVSAGVSGRQVALHGLLKPRQPDTVYGWVKRYQAKGITGLSVSSQVGDESLLTHPNIRPNRMLKKLSCILLDAPPLPLANPEVAGALAS